MKPILFSTPMVQAILNGEKTQTRRIVPERILEEYDSYDDYCNSVMPYDSVRTTYEKEFYESRARYSVGDVLWVRETFARLSDFVDPDPYPDDFIYRAGWDALDSPRWKPSIFMPREAARIFLKVVHVRAERLTDISEYDAMCEGCRPGDKYSENSTSALTAKQSYMWLWDKLNSKRGYPWIDNPWVWVIKFEVLPGATE